MAEDLDEFHGEAREILEGVAQDLVRLESQPGDADLLNRIFRGAHSLKGLAGMLGFTSVSAAAHKLETALDGVRMGRIPTDAGTLDVLLEATEVIGRMVDGVREGKPDREAAAAAESGERLDALATAGAPVASTARSIDPEVAGILSEYELHRLSLALADGLDPWRIDVSLPFETFDTDLPAIKERLKPYGEVVTTMAGDLAAADKMGFGLLVLTSKDASVLAAAVAMPDARVTPVPVVEAGAGPGAAPADGGKAVPAAAATGSFEGFSSGAGSWGIGELPPAAALGTSTTAIDWNALSQAGDVLTETPPLPPVLPPPEPERRTGQDRRGPDRRSEDRRASAPPDAASAGSATLRVNLDRIDELMNLVGELVTAKNAISQVSERLKAENGFKGATLEIFKAKRVLERRLEDLQKGVMQVRMLPLEQLFGKLSRVVRNLSRENGKEVELVLEGAETELDKVMIDELSDPLIHIVRNAIDHGLETTGQREAAGKPREGTLKIAAHPKGNHVAIEISDDGGGLDTGRIRQKAVEKGLLSPESNPSEEELFDMIFAPGFSTKETVSEISGRGVGMDVVRNNIMKLNGIIETRSERGKGTRFTITLPLTLATMRALVVGVAGQTYAIPLTSVLECVAVRKSELRTIEGKEVLPLRESTLPLVRLERFFGLDEDGFAFPGEDVPDPKLQVVVVGLAQYRVGLVVDSLGAQQDVVVKPLGAPLTDVDGIMGATNLGNNRAVLVLDVAGVVDISVGARAATAPDAAGVSR